MFDQLKSIMEMASGFTEVPRRQATKIAKEVAKRGEVRASQITKLADEIVTRSRENAEMARDLVRSEIRRQIKSLGLASKEDIERLARRVTNMESGAKPKPKPKPRSSNTKPTS
jgi:polyhydroxyalkanoate synthesis regulator phasin